LIEGKRLIRFCVTRSSAADCRNLHGVVGFFYVRNMRTTVFKQQT